MRVLLLEAGPERKPARAGRAWATRLWRHARGAQSVQEQHHEYWLKDPNLFVKDEEQRYSTPADRPFVWIRGRQLGGRTLLWGGVTVRLSDYELAASERDGYGPAWPIRYRDLAPHYDRIERFLRIHGTRDGLPQLPDGRYVGSRPLTRAERRLRDKVAAVWPERRVIPARGLALERHGGREPRPAQRGYQHRRRACDRTAAGPYRRSGQPPDPRGPVGGRRGGNVRGCGQRARHTRRGLGVIVLCASTIETVRILLATCMEHPELPVRRIGLSGPLI